MVFPCIDNLRANRKADILQQYPNHVSLGETEVPEMPLLVCINYFPPFIPLLKCGFCIIFIS